MWLVNKYCSEDQSGVTSDSVGLSFDIIVEFLFMSDFFSRLLLITSLPV